MRQGLAVELIGSFAVHRSEAVLRGPTLGSRKARILFAMLAVERGRPASLDRIVDAVWGDAPPRRPAQDTATVVSRLRAVLGPDSVVGGRTGYRLGPRVRVDLYDAGKLVEAAEAETGRDHALSSARRALDILDSGEVLTEWPEATWAEPARRLHAALVRRARHAVATTALRLGDPRTAQDVADAALAANEFDEAACRLLMRAHIAADEPAMALLAYERLRSSLAVELGVDPAPKIRELHAAILRGR